jgi:DNA-binding transcriptional MerR regulator
MLKIGEFAQLSQVTVKTLHYYDEVGLLKPAQIDPFTNYRYYTVEQLPRIHRIMALKELGLSLEQIGLMLDEDLPAEQIGGMLRLLQAQTQQQIRETQQKLAMIAFRLHLIEAEADFPELDVVVKPLEAMHSLSVFVPRPPTLDAAYQQMGTVANALRKAIQDGRIHSTGKGIDKFYGDTILESTALTYERHELLHGVTETQADIEIKGIGHFFVKEEPAVAAAVTLMLSAVDQGHLAAVEKATLLRRWAVAQGYKTADYIRFFNYRGPLQTLNRDEFVFEAQLPVEKEHKEAKQV